MSADPFGLGFGLGLGLLNGALGLCFALALVSVFLGFLSWRHEEVHYHQRRVAKPVRPVRDGLLLLLGVSVLAAGVLLSLPFLVLTAVLVASVLGFLLLFGLEAQSLKLGRRYGGVPEMVIQEEIRSAMDSLDRLVDVNDAIPDEALTAALDLIDQKCEIILKAVVAEPHKFRRVRGFLSGHLARIAEIGGEFVQLSEAKQTEGLERFKRGLKAVVKALDHEIDALDREEELDVEVALTVLERQLG